MIVAAAAAPPPSQILNGNGNQKLESLEEKWNVRIWIQFGRPECLCWQFRWRSKASAVGLVDAFNWHCRIVNSGEFDIQYLSFFKIQAAACYLFGAKILLILTVEFLLFFDWLLTDLFTFSGDLIGWQISGLSFLTGIQCQELKSTNWKKSKKSIQDFDDCILRRF